MPYPPLVRRLALAAVVAASPQARAIGDCDTPPESWQPRGAVQALAERNGWQVEHLKIDDGCYEIKGRDAQGRPFRAKVDPATMEVLHLRRGDHRIRDRERERGADRHRDAPPPSSSGVHE